jgi:hypothetical protein
VECPLVRTVRCQSPCCRIQSVVICPVVDLPPTHSFVLGSAMPPHLTRNASLPPERKRKQGRLGVHDLRPSSCCPEFGRLAYRRQVLDRQVLLKFTSIWGIGPELGLQSDRNHPQARGSGTPIKIPDAVVLTSSLHLCRGAPTPECTGRQRRRRLGLVFRSGSSYPRYGHHWCPPRPSTKRSTLPPSRMTSANNFGSMPCPLAVEPPLRL